MMPPDVAIIVLTWNGRDDTLACLQSLQQLTYPSFRVLLVDNGSKDGTTSAVAEAYPEVTVLENGTNLGFAAGNNVGLAEARRMGVKYALLLNNDTVVDPGFLEPLVDTLEASPEVGAAGPTIFYHDHPQTIWSAGGRIDWRVGNTAMIGLGEKVAVEHMGGPQQVDFVTGCALFLRVALLDQIGYLDPRFFAYYEEVEWCLRLQRAGSQIWYVPDSRVWHKISIEARSDSPLVHYYMTRNRLLFLKAARAPLRAWLHALIFEYLRTLASWTLRPKWRRKRAQRDVMLRAIWDYTRGRFGAARWASS